MLDFQEMRPAWAEINLDHLKYNYELIRRQVGEQTKIMAVVKADAYGHGAARISEYLLKLGADFLGVFLVEEGIELRKGGIKAPILILGSIPIEQANLVVDYALTPMVCNLEFAKKINELGKLNKEYMNIHIRVDIGLGSFGLYPSEVLHFMTEIKKLESIFVEGLFTHFPSTYGEDTLQIEKDIQIFKGLIKELEQEGFHIPIIHASSSTGILNHPDIHFGMVRAGIILYGLAALEHQALQFKPVMQLKSKVSIIKTIIKGTVLGYGSNYTALENLKVAVVPIGYADGLFLYYLKNGEVLIKGKRAPIIGKVFMDHFIIDISNIKTVELGEEVVLIGCQNNEEITAMEMAEKTNIGSLNSDCVCLLSNRIPRVLIDKELNENNIEVATEWGTCR